MASHYLFEATFCNPASGWEKGQVEKNVQDARRQIWQAMPPFADLPSLNAWLEARCIERWGEMPHGVMPGSVADVHARERASLMPLGRAFDGFVEHTKRVSPTCLVHFESNRYSVPASFANRPVSLRIYPDRLVVVAEGQVVCEHARIVERSHDVPGRTVYDWRHYLAVIQRKPGALRNGAPFAEMPDAFRKLQAQFLRRPYENAVSPERSTRRTVLRARSNSRVICLIDLPSTKCARLIRAIVSTTSISPTTHLHGRHHRRSEGGQFNFPRRSTTQAMGRGTTTPIINL
jgi:hypothetical protein